MQSKRLLKIAEMVRFGAVVDVGCDHAHLPVHLLKSGRARAVLATDVAAGPLMRGRENAMTAGFGDAIEFRLANGLAGVEAGKWETCVIAGMGGETIMSILHDSTDVAKSFKQLLLSPQRNVPDLRLFLHQNGFVIDNEIMMIENGKFYNILDCRVEDGAVESYDAAGYAFGKILIESKCCILKQYIKNEIRKLQMIDLDDVPNERRVQIKDYVKMCTEVLGCL